MKVFIKGLNGCGMRKADLKQYRDYFVSNGHTVVSKPQESDVIILWTCAFRRDFRDNSISQIKYYLDNFDAELFVAGCLPDIDESILKENFNGKVINWKNDEHQLDTFFGNGVKLTNVKRLLGEPLLCSNVEKFKKEHPDKDASFVDQFNKLFIAEGCKFECSYCSERLAFPPYHSFSEEEILEECKMLFLDTGVSKMMLLGDSIGDYGSDIGTDLPTLMEKILKIDSSIRIALQGYNPAHFIKFFEQMTSFLDRGKLIHLQLPIQSASDRILKDMVRPYNKQDIEKVFTLLNDKGFREFDTHLIFGFPGETEDDFEETMEFILKHRPKYVLASGYMESPVMDSAKLSNKVSVELTKDRIKRAAKIIKDAGILCNTDDSHLSAQRLRTLNII